jgi:hypothetical protein
MVASLALETALDTAIQGRQQQATAAATGASNGPDGGEQGGGAVVRNLAQELELIFKRDTGTVRYLLHTSVWRIHDILVRIRVHGLIPLINGSGSESGSFYFRH